MKSLRHLLFLLALGTLLPQTSLADGTRVGDFAYFFSGDEAIVTSHGGKNYTGSVEIPSSVVYGEKTYSVTGIGERAFYDCTELTSVTIPASVTSIGELAFYKCTNLTTVNIPVNVTSIGTSAFQDCSSLKNIAIPASVVQIGNYAFVGCSSLQSFTVDAGNACYASEDGVLMDHAKATLIQCPGGKSGAYDIPGSVTRVGNDAFVHCTGLTSVSIPNSVTRIDGSAFFGCSGLTAVTVPGSITRIENKTFQRCSGLTSVILSEGVESIGISAFYGCTGLTYVSIPGSMTTIESGVFEGCSRLEGALIPASVTNIGSYVFSGCTSMQYISVAKGNTRYASEDGVLMDYGKTTLIECPAGKAGAYTIPGGVTSIGDYAFKSCSSLTSVTIPGSVTSIGTDAFRDCTALTSVTLPSSVTSMGSYVFSGCTALTSVALSGSLTNITYGTFQDCSSLASVTIPSGMTTIGTDAFRGCTSLTSVTIPGSVTRINSRAFYGCTSLTSVTDLATEPQTLESGVFAGYGTLHVKKGYKEAYAEKDYWKNFTIVDDFDPDITVTDGEEFNSTATMDYDKVTYSRTFKNTDWQALYVPLAMRYTDWKDRFDVAAITNFHEYSENGEVKKTELEVRLVKSGTLKPNHPYLIRAKNGSETPQTIEVSDKKIYRSETNSIVCSSVECKYTFTGTYEAIDGLQTKGCIFMSGGRLSKAGNDTDVLSAQRWYLNVEDLDRQYDDNLTAGSRAMQIDILLLGDEATDIDEITVTSTLLPLSGEAMYNLNGMRVNDDCKGIVIRNGKKYYNK